jgi:hypothetical protein
MEKRMIRKFYSENSEDDDKRVESYLDQKVINANRKIDQQFYGEEEKDVDANLYNMGDSTPILNDKDTN